MEARKKQNTLVEVELVDPEPPGVLFVNPCCHCSLSVEPLGNEDFYYMAFELWLRLHVCFDFLKLECK